VAGRGPAALPVALLAMLAALPAGAAAPTARAAVLVPGHLPLPRFRHGAFAQASNHHVPDVEGIGNRTNGKVFGVDPERGPYSCSGTAINTASESIVLTAGHCVIEGGRVGEDLSFVPAFDHGERPFGTFTAQSAYVMPQWRHDENPDFDVAALRVAPDPLGKLTEVVGGRGYTYGRSRFSDLEIFGYPAAAAGGEELRDCKARGLGVDALTYRFPGPPTLPARCDLAAGSSGGAWIVDGEYVDGVTSYGYAGRPTRLYSSYFGIAVGQFLEHLP
jgi:V8-like Glu-specific endopeptidase